MNRRFAFCCVMTISVAIIATVALSFWISIKIFGGTYRVAVLDNPASLGSIYVVQESGFQRSDLWLAVLEKGDERIQLLGSVGDGATGWAPRAMYWSQDGTVFAIGRYALSEKPNNFEYLGYDFKTHTKLSSNVTSLTQKRGGKGVDVWQTLKFKEISSGEASRYIG